MLSPYTRVPLPFSVDYRAFKKTMVLDKFLIPFIDELLDELHSATIFLKSGYHHIHMKLEDMPKLVFRMHDEYNEFLMMSFGLTNPLATFQSLMNNIFHPLLKVSHASVFRQPTRV